MNKEIEFVISVETEVATLYFQKMPPMPIPRVGESLFVPGDGMGWWIVKEVRWALPSMGAMKPTMWVTIMVEWENQTKPEPMWDEDKGWILTPE